MKKKYASILLIVIGVLGIGTVAKAQIRPVIKVTLPFEFVVDGKKFPAGTYTLSRFGNDKREGLILTNYDRRTSVFVLPIDVESASSGKPEVSFHRVGEQLFLSSIRTSDDVYNIPVPPSAIVEASGRSHDNTMSSGGSGSN